MLNALQSDSVLHIQDNSVVQEAAQYHLRTGGQRLRARLALQAGQATGLCSEDSICIAAAIELLHNASLIHDDLQDGDQYRRGYESVWSKYGSNVAICCGDLYLSTAYSVIAGINPSRALPRIIQTMHQRITQAIYGQCADLTLQTKHVSLETYIQVVMAKSGALLSLPLELVLLLTDQDQSIPLANQACKDFAIGFQIYDDLKDASEDAQQSPNGHVRLNIVSIIEYLNKDSEAYIDPHIGSKNIAIQYLKRSEHALAQLPSRSGQLLEECAQNICSLVKAL